MAQQKLSEQQMDEIEEALALVGVDSSPDSYSGRGMYGQQCLGIDFDDMGEAFRFALLLGDDLAGILARPSFDSMGLGIVAYWPNVEAPEVADEDDEDDEG